MRSIMKTVAVIAVTLFLSSPVLAEDGLLPPPPAPGIDLPPPPALGGDDLGLPAAPALSGEDSQAPLPAASGEIEAPALPGLPDAPPIAPEADFGTESVEVTDILEQEGPVGGVQGEISGKRVNIRAGASTKYEIVMTADLDTPVTVMERVGDWVMIAYPESQYCYISLKYIDGDIPAEIPQSGLARTVRGDKVSVRARQWTGSTIVGKLNRGDTVIVTGIRGQWARIRPPASARAWVFHKYVSYEQEGIKVTEVKETDEFTAKIKGAVEEIKKDQKKDPLMEKIAARAAAERKVREARRQNVRNILNSVEQQLEMIEREAEVQKKQVFERRVYQKEAEKEAIKRLEEDYVPPPPPGNRESDASGWVRYVGYLRGRPAGFSLVKGGETIYLMRSIKYDLNKLIGKQIRVSGKVVPAPAWEADVMTVTDLTLFDGTPVDSLQNVRLPREEVNIREPGVSITEMETNPIDTIVIDESFATPEDGVDITGLDE